jgi:hypothetical protein
VFLTGSEAWKVKRPVDLGFLDYSDALGRRRCCEEEVRLGARLAPDVYLGVAPVYLGRAGHRFVGPGAVVDHAVRMRRLDDEESALHLLRAGRLAPAQLRALAARLADFFAAAPVTPGFGSPAVLAANVRENYDQSLPFAGRAIGAAELEALHHWHQGELFALEGRLSERQTEGWIREGHGDLRLEHVYFPARLGGAPLAIDPIEFAARFRCQDVALDVAFLAMEFEAEGRADLAAVLLSRFARETDDFGFYPLLDLYLAYRAWVRAKVACFVADDPATSPAVARRKIEEAARLFALAATHTRPQARARHVIAVGGPAGAGKSTLAEALGAALRMPVISSDATRKRLAGLRPTERGGPALYTEELTARTYEGLARRAQSVLDSGRGVILDATFRAPALRGIARTLAADGDRPFLFLELDAHDEVLRARLRRRTHEGGESDAREELLPAMRASFRAALELRADERLPLDGTLPPEALVEQVRGRVDGAAAPL